MDASLHRWCGSVAWDEWWRGRMLIDLRRHWQWSPKKINAFVPFVFHMNLCVMGYSLNTSGSLIWTQVKKQRIFDSSVTQAQCLESLKDDNQFLGDGSSSAALIKTLSSPFSLRVGAVEKMWCCGVCCRLSILSLLVFLSSYPSGSSFPLPPFTTHVVPLTPWILLCAPLLSLFSPLCPLWLSQVRAQSFGPKSGLCPHQNNNWPCRVRRVSVSVCHSAC